jgi:glucokinase-like ROK family protein
MGNLRDASLRKLRLSDGPDIPAWLEHADKLPNRNFITISEKDILDFARSYPTFSKADLVTHTNYSRTKITTCIDSLLKKNILIAGPTTDYTGGRRSQVFSLNGGLGYVAGVDIGATSLDLLIADFAGVRLARCSEAASVRDGPLKVLGRVCSLIEKLLQEHHLDPARLAGVGIGIPGPVDFSLGMAVSPPIMPGWDRYPVIQTVQQWFPGANVVIDNDVNVMALGEIYQGAGRGVSNLIFIKIGTGIGSGIICDGRIYRGSCGCAGDIGHISVDKNGPLCPCGNKGCLEAVAGGPAIAERALAGAQAGRSPTLMNYYYRNGGVLHAKDVGDAAKEGDALAIEVIRESGQFIGDVLASLVNFYNPDMIVIGGGVSNLGNLLLSTIRQSVLNRSLPLATRDLHIVFSSIGADAGVIGAVNLAMDYMFTLSSGNGEHPLSDE